MTLISLAYVSASSRDMTNDDLTDILTTARSHNSANNITGMLLYRNGYFIQALEGEEQVVRALYDKISKDSRHRNVLTVQQEEIQERSFGEWSMGFHNLDAEEVESLSGYTDFLDQPFDTDVIAKSGNRAVTLLELFKEGGSY
jgi:hypothetical protein